MYNCRASITASANATETNAVITASGDLDASDVDLDLGTGDDDESADREPSLGSADQVGNQERAWATGPSMIDCEIADPRRRRPAEEDPLGIGDHNGQLQSVDPSTLGAGGVVRSPPIIPARLVKFLNRRLLRFGQSRIA